MRLQIKKDGLHLLDNVPPGTCPECATKHDPGDPHNQRSLTYQYKFYARNGRWPTWDDAMAHCSPETKVIWKKALHRHGID